MIHQLVLHNFHPVSVNGLLGRHFKCRSRLKKKQGEVVAGLAMQQRIPRATGKRLVSYRFEGWKNGQLPDGENLLKVLSDNLVACGLLKDDGPEWCKIGDIVGPIRSPHYTTVITLEDLED